MNAEIVKRSGFGFRSVGLGDDGFRLVGFRRHFGSGDGIRNGRRNSNRLFFRGGFFPDFPLEKQEDDDVQHGFNGQQDADNQFLFISEESRIQQGDDAEDDREGGQDQQDPPFFSTQGFPVKGVLDLQETAEEQRQANMREDKKAAAQTEDVIDSIPEKITLDAEAAVEQARASYNQLTDDQKSYVKKGSLEKLTSAEKKLEKLLEEEEKEED